MPHAQMHGRSHPLPNALLCAVCQSSLHTVSKACGVTENAHICNFKAIGRNNTHVTFSWDVVDDPYSSDLVETNHINHFQLHYKERKANWSSVYIPYSIATRRGSATPTFTFSTKIATFGKMGVYIMQLSVYRHKLVPKYVYSKHVSVDLGMYGFTVII